MLDSATETLVNYILEFRNSEFNARLNTLLWPTKNEDSNDIEKEIFDTSLLPLPNVTLAQKICHVSTFKGNLIKNNFFEASGLFYSIEWSVFRPLITAPLWLVVSGLIWNLFIWVNFLYYLKTN